MNKSKGFTLIELLIVFFIVGLMASLMLPAIAKAEGKAKEVVCLDNLKEIAYATYNYSEDFNGYVLSASGQIEGEWYVWQDYLYNEEIKSEDSFICSGQKDYFNPYGSALPKDLSTASYVMNTIGEGNWNGAAISSDTSKSTGWGYDTNSPVKIQSVRQPENKIFIADSYVDYSGNSISSSDARGIRQYLETDHGPDSLKDVGNHHDKGFNALFGDGHAGRLLSGSSEPDQWVVVVEE